MAKKKKTREEYLAWKKQYYQNHKELWRIENTEKIRQRKKDWVEKNRDKVFAQRKQYREKNKKRLSLIKKEYTKKNKGRKRQYDIEYRVKNAAKLLEYKREYGKSENAKLSAKKSYRKYKKKRTIVNKKWALNNPEKIKIIRHRWVKNNPEKVLEAHIKMRYGINKQQYNKLFEDQNGCCAICGTHQKDLKRTLCIDHCHVTLKVRGLLCSNCNSILGHSHDNQEILKNAITYLSKANDLQKSHELSHLQ